MPSQVHSLFDAATVTLNPAIDRTIRIKGLVPGAVNRAELVGDRAGGKGINVAAALAEQGHPTTALGFLGRDNDAIFSEFFNTLGVKDDCLRLPGSTRTGIKVIDTQRGETTDINFPGLKPTHNDLAILTRQLDTLLARWCVLAGSLPPGVPPTFYAEAISRLKSRGVRVALDTSGEALHIATQSSPDFVKPNIHELEDLVGRKLENTNAVIDAARNLVHSGVRLVVVSMGADGAFFVSEDEAVRARPPQIEVRSTVGAGDAMVAGIVAAQLRGLSLSECARLSTAYSLFALTRNDAALGPRSAVAALGARIKISAD